MKNIINFTQAVSIMLIIYSFIILCSFISSKKYPYAHDGDTIEIWDSINHKQQGIRIANIDAPELLQPYGTTSRDSLQQLILTKKLSIQITNTDKYGRLVAVLRFNGCRYDSLAVLKGWVYVYPHYCNFYQLYSLEIRAKFNHSGVWNIQPQVRPWDYRHSNK